jgi:hypothetical protein
MIGRVNAAAAGLLGENEILPADRFDTLTSSLNPHPEVPSPLSSQLLPVIPPPSLTSRVIASASAAVAEERPAPSGVATAGGSEGLAVQCEGI